MIPDVAYRFTIRPLPADEGGGYSIEFPGLQVGRRDDRGSDHQPHRPQARLDRSGARRGASDPPHRPAPRGHEPPATYVNCFTSTPRTDGID
jgi:hypothetical protein